MATSAELQGLQIEFLRFKERFPPLATIVKNSFWVPQSGKFHNEGSVLADHLSLMLKTALDVLSQKFHPELFEKYPDVCRDIYQTIGGSTEISIQVLDYIFIHDMSKQFRVLLHLCNRKGKCKKVEIEDWKQSLKKGISWYKRYKIIGISYYHPSKEPHLIRHGQHAEDFLKSHHLPIDKKILKIISIHESLTLFATCQNQLPSLSVYEKFVTENSMSDEELSFFVAMGYLESMSCILPNGNPRMERMLNFIYVRNLYNQEEVKKKETKS